MLSRDVRLDPWRRYLRQRGLVPSEDLLRDAQLLLDLLAEDEKKHGKSMKIHENPRLSSS